MKDKNLVIHSFKIYGNEMPTEARLSGWERPAREPEWEAQEDFPGSLVKSISQQWVGVPGGGD